jgi:hypothetical protein
MKERPLAISTVALLASLEPPEHWYRDHVTSGLPCACNVSGPEPGCAVGEALYRVQEQEPWDVRSKSWARERGRLSPWE